jgi:hypothetical protein
LPRYLVKAAEPLNENPIEISPLPPFFLDKATRFPLRLYFSSQRKEVCAPSSSCHSQHVLSECCCAHVLFLTLDLCVVSMRVRKPERAGRLAAADRQRPCLCAETTLFHPQCATRLHSHQRRCPPRTATSTLMSSSWLSYQVKLCATKAGSVPPNNQ